MARFHDTFFSREARYSLGIEQESGRAYLSIPVTTGVVDYEEPYALEADEYEEFLADPERAMAFADSCRQRRHDDRLMHRPGWNRGIAT